MWGSNATVPREEKKQTSNSYFVVDNPKEGTISWIDHRSVKRTLCNSRDFLSEFQWESGIRRDAIKTTRPVDFIVWILCPRFILFLSLWLVQVQITIKVSVVLQMAYLTENLIILMYCLICYNTSFLLWEVFSLSHRHYQSKDRSRKGLNVDKTSQDVVYLAQLMSDEITGLLMEFPAARRYEDN